MVHFLSGTGSTVTFPELQKPEIVCIIFCCTWNAKCPIFLGNFINFTPKNQQLLP